MITGNYSGHGTVEFVAQLTEWQRARAAAQYHHHARHRTEPEPFPRDSANPPPREIPLYRARLNRLSYYYHSLPRPAGISFYFYAQCGCGSAFLHYRESCFLPLRLRRSSTARPLTVRERLRNP